MQGQNFIKDTFGMNLTNSSVILPVYNSERALTEALARVLIQSVSPDEALVGDGSPIATVRALGEFIDWYSRA